MKPQVCPLSCCRSQYHSFSHFLLSFFIYLFFSSCTSSFSSLLSLPYVSLAAKFNMSFLNNIISPIFSIYTFFPHTRVQVSLSLLPSFPSDTGHSASLPTYVWVYLCRCLVGVGGRRREGKGGGSRNVGLHKAPQVVIIGNSFSPSTRLTLLVTFYGVTLLLRCSFFFSLRNRYSFL